MLQNVHIACTYTVYHYLRYIYIYIMHAYTLLSEYSMHCVQYLIIVFNVVYKLIYQTIDANKGYLIKYTVIEYPFIS